MLGKVSTSKRKDIVFGMRCLLLEFGKTKLEMWKFIEKLKGHFLIYFYIFVKWCWHFISWSVLYNVCISYQFHFFSSVQINVSTSVFLITFELNFSQFFFFSSLFLFQFFSPHSLQPHFKWIQEKITEFILNLIWKWTEIMAVFHKNKHFGLISFLFLI